MKINLGILRKLSIRMKLVWAFSSLVVMIGLAGGSGLLFVDQIRGNVIELSDVAGPLNDLSNTLTMEMRKFHITTLNLLTIKDSEDIQSQSFSLESQKMQFLETLKKLSTLIEVQEIQLDLQQVQNNQQKFFSQALAIVDAHRARLDQESVIVDSLEDFDQKRLELDRLIANFVNTALTSLGEKEDGSKTLIQTGNATVESLGILLEEIFDQDFPLVDGGGKLRSYLIQMQDIAKTYVAEEDLDQLPSIQKKFEKIVKKATARLKRLKRRLKSEEAKQSHQKIKAGLTTLKESVLREGGLLTIHQEDLLAAANIRRLQSFLIKAIRNFNNALRKILITSRQLNTQAQSTAKYKVSQAQTIIGVIVATGIFFGILFAWLIIRSITLPLFRVKEMIEGMSEGNLKHRLKLRNRDELGTIATVMNNFSERLHNIMVKINQAGGEVSNGAERICNSSHVIAQGASQQVVTLDAITTSMQSISSQTKMNAQSAIQTRQLADSARQQAEEGNLQMQDMLKAMGEISQSSEEVSKFMQTIEEIAFYTNILALNAAIEAACAGEHGRGFAVVAQEVRKLAQRSAEAAKETTTLIKDSLEKVKMGTQIAVKTASSLSEIVQSSGKVTVLINEITVASNEQTQGINEITQGMGQLNQTAQQNAQVSKDSVAASEELTSQAQQLIQLVSHFELQHQGHETLHKKAEEI